MQDSIDLKAKKESSKKEIENWLFDHGGITGNWAISYVNLLLVYGVGTVECLERKLNLDNCLLQKAGFDADDIDAIMHSYSTNSSASGEKKQHDKSSSSGSAVAAAVVSNPPIVSPAGHGNSYPVQIKSGGLNKNQEGCRQSLIAPSQALNQQQ